MCHVSSLWGNVSSLWGNVSSLWGNVSSLLATGFGFARREAKRSAACSPLHCDRTAEDISAISEAPRCGGGGSSSLAASLSEEGERARVDGANDGATGVGRSGSSRYGPEIIRDGSEISRYGSEIIRDGSEITSRSRRRMR